MQRSYFYATLYNLYMVVQVQELEVCMLHIVTTQAATRGLGREPEDRWQLPVAGRGHSGHQTHAATGSWEQDSNGST